MKHLLTVITLFIFVVSTSAQTIWNPIAEKVEKSLALMLVGQKGACTVFSINEKENYVMTANHCFGDDIDGKDLVVENIPAKLVAKDAKKDLLVLYVKGLDKPALHLAKHDPRIGDEIASYGFGYALSKPLFRVTHVSASDTEETPNQIITDTDFTPGQSGGPVVDGNGDVVMIVQAGDGHGLGIGIGAETIKKQMGRYFEAVK